MPDDIFRKRRLVVLGARSVGKSSLVLQYVEKHFIESYHPTVESFFTKTITVNGIEYETAILDTAGQDEFSIFNSKHAIGIHGYVLVYSVASRQSFEMVKIIYDKIIDFCGLRAIPCVIVGSKSDLQRREVPTTEAQALATRLGCGFIETSARENSNVDKVFELCLQEVDKTGRYRRRHYGVQPVEPPPGNNCTIM
ncbi:small GTPase superfamily [Auriculariales sp. MPI-PUGE-AT-0066]|nr:small GTPase superfamily [Auriculariales sp. MPI-PUGE-AT-0066]